MPTMTWNTILTTFSLGLGLVGITQAQTAQSTSTAFTDDKTGIQFQQTTKGDYTFGIALPAKSNGDLIGRISAKGQGWAGVSLGGPMANSLMVIAWPHQKKIVSTLRHSQGYSVPNPTTNTSISLQTISASVDGTTYTYTFLCKGCIQSDSSTFKADADLPTIGYAQAAVPVTTPADPLSPMAFHSSGYGLFQVNLAAARSAKFATWAALAKNDPKADAPRTGGATPPPPNNSATTSSTTFDYIVIGSGPAGLITSQRLTETGKSVLLLERGGPSIASTGGKRYVAWNQSLTLYDVPGLFLNMAVRTLGEGFCLDTAGLGGCILGGGGTMNGMAFIHPPSWDFDDKWPAGWKSKDMAPAAKRLYARNPGTTMPSKDGKYYDNEVYTVMAEWFKSNGWNYADSIQSPDDKNRSYGHPALNVANGLRSGPLMTYLPLAKAKLNFKLQINTKALRVVRDGSKMTGVEVEHSRGQREIINLKPGGSVILAAGVLSTPRLLWHSGIGRKEQINIVKTGRSRIKLPEESDWINLPVGENVQDHSRYMLTFNVASGVKSMTNLQLYNPPASDKALFQAGSGVLTQSFMRMDTFRRVKTSDGHNIYFQAHVSPPMLGTPNQIEFTMLMTHGLTSKGTMSITAFDNTVFSKQPWLQTDTDKEAWTLALDDLFNMTRKAGSKIVYSGGKDATAATVLRTPVQQGVHFAGGAKIGEDDGRKGGSAVVDLNTKVYGTDNLYIVDASFHADLPTGNSQAIVMVAAEHAVQKIIAMGGK